MGVEAEKIHQTPIPDDQEASAQEAPVTQPEATSADFASTSGAQIEVFDRLVELQSRLAAAEAELERRRALNNARSQRWRAKHPEEARRQSRETVRASRARKRQNPS